MSELLSITHAQALFVGGDPYPTHFADRAAERGIKSINGFALKESIEWAVQTGRDDIVEHVKTFPDGSNIYRFRVEEGLFYAIVKGNGSAVTVYTQDMARRKKQTIKWGKRPRRSRVKP